MRQREEAAQLGLGREGHEMAASQRGTQESGEGESGRSSGSDSGWRRSSGLGA